MNLVRWGGLRSRMFIAALAGGLVTTVVAQPTGDTGDQAGDGRIFVIYDRNRKTDREILVASFTEEDIAAGALVDRRSALRLLVNTANQPTPAP